MILIINMQVSNAIEEELFSLQEREILSEKEFIVLLMTIRGFTLEEIMNETDLNAHSVRQYRSNAKKKIDIFLKSLPKNSFVNLRSALAL